MENVALNCIRMRNYLTGDELKNVQQLTMKPMPTVAANDDGWN